MNRIDHTLARLKESGKKMISPYITAGDPKPSMTIPLMHELVRAGADILELGIPFSDPMAEGPVIQHAMERALAHGIHTDNVLDMVNVFRKDDTQTPVIIMGYLNPIEQYGYEQFAKQAAAVGVDGTILVDLPPEESEEIAAVWKKHGLYLIYLCSPTTSEERMRLLNELGEGYLYYVSLKGVTGAGSLEIDTLKSQYAARKAQTNLPLMVGFGIKTPKMAAQIAAFADGVIVGAALIQAIIDAKEQGLEAGASLIRNMRSSIDSGLKA
jgi:tryptophan synthase alpha chain